MYTMAIVFSVCCRVLWGWLLGLNLYSWKHNLAALRYLPFITAQLHVTPKVPRISKKLTSAESIKMPFSNLYNALKKEIVSILRNKNTLIKLGSKVWQINKNIDFLRKQETILEFTQILPQIHGQSCGLSEPPSDKLKREVNFRRRQHKDTITVTIAKRLSDRARTPFCGNISSCIATQETFKSTNKDFGCF